MGTPPDFDFTGVERLKHRPDEELLLRALVQTFLDHSLCIAEDTPHGRHLVFPSQYRREKDIPHEPDIFVSYTFSGEWQTAWTTLVVRLWYSQEFAHRELWRNAAELESARKQTLGLKITKTGDGAATISLYFDPKVEEHQRCANKPAQGNALGGAFKTCQSPERAAQDFTPLQGFFMLDQLPRALPWAGLLPGLWP